MDMWRDMGRMSNLSELEQMRGKMGMRAKKAHFFYSTQESKRGEERVEREAPTYLYDLRSSVFVELRTKVYLRDESYT